ncbi:adenine phosphoribosyltransferase [Parvularcula dongshanensis]|uniref:Adenine phosphoribosyltransferase n=1 Tax=Parvularcula dongshanensis TaxID=1173995 RepID=A0A840I2D1_9PROT|nr:adenine phosphoribosyltransferase [Parvularcula dongshanensis]MBB4658452.1 adenine phosphoribosyltransferase [Parvularcula dongshanensis]
MDLKTAIRAIPDHPKPGIVYRDITPLMADGEAFRRTVEGLASAFKAHRIDKVAGIEARGFVFGAALATALGAGFVPVRKRGKLPHDTISRSYSLEYGEDVLELHRDAVAPGERVLLIDDLIATGGTAVAAAELLAELGARPVACAFVIELEGLGGREALAGLTDEVFSLMQFGDD